MKVSSQEQEIYNQKVNLRSSAEEFLHDLGKHKHFLQEDTKGADKKTDKLDSPPVGMTLSRKDGN